MNDAIVCRIKTRPHPNADRLQIGTVVGGYTVVVGTETQDNELGIFFSSELALSPKMLMANDLVGYTDENGNRSGGFFSSNGRVRAQSFRGVKSHGFWCPLSFLEWTGINVDDLVEGYRFTELNGHEVCHKYVTPATLNVMRGQTKAGRAHPHFLKHVDTDQFKHAKSSIEPGSVIYLSEKLHGTSQRVGKHFVNVKVDGRWRRFANRITGKPNIYNELRVLYGTRNVVLSRYDVFEGPYIRSVGDAGLGYHGPESFRFESVANFIGNLRDGETVYGEVVGYAGEKLIMGSQDTTKLRDKNLKSRYGPTMEYTYGTIRGEAKFFVYRITQAAYSDGEAFHHELSWPQVERRCLEIGASPVPLLAHPYVFNPDELDEFSNTVETLGEGTSTLDVRHIREGVVLRVESPSGHTQFLKHKSFNFLVLEGHQKENEDYVDTEEIA